MCGEVTESCGKRVWSRSDGVRDVMDWRDTQHEEPDNRILVHVKDIMVENGCKNRRHLRLKSDVVVIMLAFMPYLNYHDSEVKVQKDFGKGDHRRMISLYQ